MGRSANFSIVVHVFIYTGFTQSPERTSELIIYLNYNSFLLQWKALEESFVPDSEKCKGIQWHLAFVVYSVSDLRHILVDLTSSGVQFFKLRG